MLRLSCALAGLGAMVLSAACGKFGAAGDDPPQDTPDTGAGVDAAVDAAPVERRIYVFGGESSNILGTMTPAVTHAYVATLTGDGGIDAWSRAPLLDGDRAAMGAVFHAGTQFSFGGLVGGTLSDSGEKAAVDMLPGTSSAWSSVARLIEGRSHVATAALGTSIYMSGGRSAGGARSDRIDRYDTSSDVWTTVGKLSEPLAGHSMTMIGSRAYVVGGERVATVSGDLSSSKTWMAEIAGDGKFSGWIDAGSLPSPISFHALAHVDRWFFAIGGASADLIRGRDSVMRGTPDNAGNVTWESITPLPLPPGHQGLAGACAVTVDRTIYILGGRGNVAEPSFGSVYAGLVDANGVVSWRVLPSFAEGRSLGGCAVSSRQLP